MEKSQSKFRLQCLLLILALTSFTSTLVAEDKPASETKSKSKSTSKTIDSEVPDSTISGAILFKNLCAECHQVDGAPTPLALQVLTPPPPHLRDIPTKAHENKTPPKDYIFEKIYNGGKNMIPYRYQLEKSQISALANYVEARFTLKEKATTKK